jgi:hypothetical protein
MSNTYIPIIDPDTGAVVRIPAQVLSDGSTNLALIGESKLATKDLVDMNTATATLLYTVPAERSCVITRVVIRKASTSLTTVSVCFGWTGATYNDVIATATHVELTGATLATVLIPKVGALVGVSAATFKVLDTILQGGAATVSIDVYGILF